MVKKRDSRVDCEVRDRRVSSVVGVTLRVVIAAAACIVVLAPRTMHAQQPGWSGLVEASGSLLFGNASDQLVSAQLRLGRADSVLEVRTDGRFTYGAARADEGGRRVTARTAVASLGLDYRPFDRYSPFVFASIESSLQQQIARRIATGAGAKLTFHRRGEDEGSISLALLAEQTKPRRAPTDVERDASVWRSRWSLRGRTRKQLTSTLRFTHVTLYQPSMEQLSRYTIISTTTLAMAITGSVALTMTLHDNYDSEARGRGARSNNDGQFLFGVRAEF